MDQHYLPRFLLSEWVDPADEMVRSYRVDLPQMPVSRRAPKGTGFEPDLWSFKTEHVAEDKRHLLETRFFQCIDDDASRVHRKLVATPVADLTHEEQNDWARFLMSLRMRQPKIIAEVRRFASERLRRELNKVPEDYQALAGDTDPPTLAEFAELQFPGLIEEIALHWYPSLVDHQGVGQRLVELRWSVRDVSHAASEFLIADEPWIIEPGLDDPDLICALPLSPTRVFLATRGERAYSRVMDREPVELVRRVNRASYTQSAKRIYGRDDRYRTFLEECERDLGEERRRVIEKNHQLAG